MPLRERGGQRGKLQGEYLENKEEKEIARGYLSVPYLLHSNIKWCVEISHPVFKIIEKKDFQLEETFLINAQWKIMNCPSFL